MGCWQERCSPSTFFNGPWQRRSRGFATRSTGWRPRDSRNSGVSADFRVGSVRIRTCGRRAPSYRQPPSDPSRPRRSWPNHERPSAPPDGGRSERMRRSMRSTCHSWLHEVAQSRSRTPSGATGAHRLTAPTGPKPFFRCHPDNPFGPLDGCAEHWPGALLTPMLHGSLGIKSLFIARTDWPRRARMRAVAAPITDSPTPPFAAWRSELAGSLRSSSARLGLHRR